MITSEEVSGFDPNIEEGDVDPRKGPRFTNKERENPGKTPYSDSIYELVNTISRHTITNALVRTFGLG